MLWYSFPRAGQKVTAPVKRPSPRIGVHIHVTPVLIGLSFRIIIPVPAGTGRPRVPLVGHHQRVSAAVHQVTRIRVTFHAFI